MSHLRSILEFFESYYKPVCTSPVKSYILCIRWLMFFPLFLGKVNAITTYSKSSGYAVFGSSKPCIVKLNQNFPCMFVDLSLNIWYQFSIAVPSNLFWINLNSPFLFPDLNSNIWNHLSIGHALDFVLDQYEFTNPNSYSPFPSPNSPLPNPYSHACLLT